MTFGAQESPVLDAPVLSAPILSVHSLTMRFGGILAIDSLDFSAQTGQVTAVIGPNGAGKTTAFNCVTGFYKPTGGEIIVQTGAGSLRIDRLPGHKIVSQARIARTFQNIRLFAGMTALENLLVAQHRALSGGGLLQLQGLIGLPGYRRAEKAAVEKAMGWLDRMGLADRADDDAGTLPYGLQRRLEIARAMCLDPNFLCLDEPAAGLNPKESSVLGADLRRLTREDGIGVLLIEHDMSVVMNVSDKIVVLDYGRKIAEGTPLQVRDNPKVIEAYLGAAAESEAKPVSRAPAAFATPILKLEKINAGYGKVAVLHDLDLVVNEGEIVTLLGANGAGKSTLLRALFGRPRPTSGEVFFQGRSIKGLPAHDVAKLGIAHAPEGRRIMPKMTVLENLQIGAHTSDPKHFERDSDKVFALFPRLAERRKQRAGTMSGGEQQMLAIGRALMQRPKLLLLDEPSLGLAPLVIKLIFDAIRDINETDGITILLVEQNAAQALAIADRGYVLQTGRVVHAGAASVLLGMPEIRGAYLEGMSAAH